MDGIIPILKERGMTSHDVVFKARKILGTKKIGHSGTLDPNVDGVLPLGIGKGTKTIEYMMASYKRYSGEITIGFSTTTEDLDGEIVKSTEMLEEDLTSDMVDRQLQSFVGEIFQVPPMYSAVRVNGRRLYDYARSNEKVKRPIRQVTIHSFERTSNLVYNDREKNFTFNFTVQCSKGTYVRTLAVDLGKKLGFPACMTKLTRIESDGFSADQSLTLKQVEELVEEDKIDQALRPLESALSHLASYNLSSAEWNRVKHGALLNRSEYGEHYPLVLYYQNRAVAIYDTHPSKTHLIKPKKVLQTEL